MLVLYSQLLVRVFMGSDELNLFFLKWITRRLRHFLIIPTFCGLPKIHKPSSPLRPIISSIGNATHKIARAIAKILTSLQGTISLLHVINFNDLLRYYFSLHKWTFYGRGGVIPPCRDAVGVFFSPSRPSKSYPGYTLWERLTRLQRCSWCILQYSTSQLDRSFWMRPRTVLNDFCIYIALAKSVPYSQLTLDTAMCEIDRYCS